GRRQAGRRAAVCRAFAGYRDSSVESSAAHWYGVAEREGFGRTVSLGNGGARESSSGKRSLLSRGDRGFESRFLQRRVSCKPPLRQKYAGCAVHSFPL